MRWIVAMAALLAAMSMGMGQGKKDKLKDPWKNDPCPPTWCDVAPPDLGDEPWRP